MINEEKNKLLEVFPNPDSKRIYVIKHVVHEFTSVCPKTGHPDFGVYKVLFVPKDYCVELKSLKLYMQSYRNDGIFYESASNNILDDLCHVIKPYVMVLKGRFTGRGGIHSEIKLIYKDEDFHKYENQIKELNIF